MTTAIQTITADELREMIEKFEDFTLVEVLPEEKFREGHIPGALSIPLEALEQRAPEALGNKDQKIIVYCANRECPASSKAAQKLRDRGYTHVIDFEEGKAGWEEAGYLLERRTRLP